MSAASFAKFQKLGRALMLPIAVLPVAGLLLRLGQPDLLNIKWIADAGGAIFTNLPLIFSIGVAVGFAKRTTAQPLWPGLRPPPRVLSSFTRAPRIPNI